MSMFNGDLDGVSGDTGDLGNSENYVDFGDGDGVNDFDDVTGHDEVDDVTGHDEVDDAPQLVTEEDLTEDFEFDDVTEKTDSNDVGKSLEVKTGDDLAEEFDDVTHDEKEDSDNSNDDIDGVKDNSDQKDTQNNNELKDETSEKKGDGSRCPIEGHNGHWDGVRGDSVWRPDKDYIPPEKSRNPDKPYSNPEKKNWDELLKKYDIEGIKFKDGFPDFSEISKGTVEIDDFETGKSDAKARNFIRADRKLAEEKGYSPDDVAKWRETNNYTWHECEDKRTMQLVPNEIHANIPHNGGRSRS